MRGVFLMKNFSKVFVAGIMAASMVLFAGCGNGGDANQGYRC